MDNNSPKLKSGYIDSLRADVRRIVDGIKTVPKALGKLDQQPPTNRFCIFTLNNARVNQL
jgi:hypothetical protein